METWIERDGAVAEIKRAETGTYQATLADGMRWEGLGLGRVYFEAGRATWYPAGTLTAGEIRAAAAGG